MGDRLLRRREVEEITSLSRSSIYRSMQEGGLPAAGTGWACRRPVESERHHGLDGIASGGEGRA